MLGWLAVVFLVVPIIELVVIIQVGQVIGPWYTVALLVAISVAGAWLVKREGLGVVRRAQERMAHGAVPGRELVDGVMILFAGALLITPGFLSDVLGVLLLLPPVRAALRGNVTRQLQRRAGLDSFRGGRW